MKQNTTKSAHFLGGLIIVIAASTGLAGTCMYLSLAGDAVAAPIILKAPLQLSPVIAATIPKPSDIVIAGLEADTVLGGLSWKNTTSQPIQIRKVYFSVAGGESYAADFERVGIRKQNGSVAYGYTDSSGNGSIDVYDSPIILNANTTTQSDLVARFNATIPGSIAGGNWTSFSRSGHQPTIAITGFDRVASNGVVTKQTVSGVKTSPMVLRKTRPIVKPVALPSATLTNSDLDLIKFQVSAAPSAAIGWKQIMFKYTKSSGVQLSNFRLRRGATDVSISEYSIVDGQGMDLQTKTIPATIQNGYVIVSFPAGREEVISGSGQVYTLHATVSGASAGKTVTFSLYVAQPKVITGYVSNRGYSSPLSAPSPKIYHIAQTETQQGILAATGDFVWSDMSEVPHTDDGASTPSSKDWTNGTYVQSLNQVSKLVF